ncbi:hypothetical protein ERO13_A11G316460v2 [Gossypium hirsutum]|nr:hypothetical protein ERO13_A11G316460v2 [Gossypium hirsutum]
MAEAIASDIAAELVIKLSSRAFSQIGLWWNLKDDLNDLKRTVSTIKAVLLDAEEKSVTNNLVKVWLEELKDVLYDADDLLDDFSTEALRNDLMGGNKLMKEVRLFFSSSNHFAYGLKMGLKIKAIKARLASIGSEANTFGFTVRDRPVETSFMTKKRQKTHSFKDKIIGREDDKAALLKLVLEFESEENVYSIPIVGFGGLGKTALAQFVYNDKMVYDYFELRMWVYKIGGKKFLLVLDDIWNEEREEWVSLKELLVGGAKGSRIIVTTRSFKVAKVTSKCQPHVLKGLSDDDAWSLFKEIAFEQRYSDLTNSAFVEIGKQILERCSGVPLVIKAIASTLSYKETEKEWSSFKDNELVTISQNDGKILSTLKLSYDNLPSHLKHCFAYCRLYPKDHQIHVKTLIQFWIAQGFIKQLNPSQSFQEIGFGYFKDLVERSLFQEVGKRYPREGLRCKMHDLMHDRYPGEGLTCKMHDLMHDLAESVAGTESSIVDSNKIASKAGEKCRHVSINPSLIHLLKEKKLRTLLHFSHCTPQNFRNEIWDLIIANCKYLRVLKLDLVNFKTVPHSIYKLKHLRYLDLSSNFSLKILPHSICKIQNLLALKLDCCSRLQELPKKIEKLVNLTHLACRGCSDLTHMPRGIGKLSSLETLSMFVVDKDGSHGGADLSELSALNNLREDLTIKNLGFVQNAKEKFKAANLKEKQRLRLLVLEWNGDNDDDDKSLEDLQPHPNLKELCIRGWRGDAKFPSWISLLTNLVDISIYGPSKFKHLPSFAQFPFLQQLKIFDLTELECMDDNGPKGSQGESESFFPSLKYLRLHNCPNMKIMGTSTMAFPCLSSLIIQNCPLTLMPLYPSLDEDLLLANTSSRPLKQTIKMNITSISRSTSTPSLPLSKLKGFHVAKIEGLDTHMLDESLQLFTGLKKLRIKDFKEVDLEGMQWEALKNLSYLEIANFPQMVSLPLGLQHLVQLKRLKIINCSGLRSLFPVLQHLTFLEEFEAMDCKELKLSAAEIQIFQDHTRSWRILRRVNS